MKIKIYFLTTILSATLSIGIAQIAPPNGNFESWTTNSKSLPYPVGWTSSNDNNWVYQSVDKTAGRTGLYAVHLLKNSEPTGFLGVEGGWVDFSSGLVNYRPVTLTGYWKGNFNSGNDNIRAEI